MYDQHDDAEERLVLTVITQQMMDIVRDGSVRTAEPTVQGPLSMPAANVEESKADEQADTILAVFVTKTNADVVLRNETIFYTMTSTVERLILSGNYQDSLYSFSLGCVAARSAMLATSLSWPIFSEFSRAPSSFMASSSSS